MAEVAFSVWVLLVQSIFSSSSLAPIRGCSGGLENMQMTDKNVCICEGWLGQDNSDAAGCDDGPKDKYPYHHSPFFFPAYPPLPPALSMGIQSSDMSIVGVPRMGVEDCLSPMLHFMNRDIQSLQDEKYYMTNCHSFKCSCPSNAVNIPAPSLCTQRVL